jgi:hypothetical protein
MALFVAAVALQERWTSMTGTRSPTAITNGLLSWLATAIDKRASFMGDSFDRFAG